MANVLGITLTVGSPTTGIWCDGCLTSAVVQWPVLLLSPNGVGDGGTVRKCVRCDV